MSETKWGCEIDIVVVGRGLAAYFNGLVQSVYYCNVVIATSVPF